MGIEVDALKSLTGAWTVAARPCDSCKTASSAVFCRVDSAFLCLTCDSRIHGPHGSKVVSRHDRVWMCEVCEQAPAAVTCKADAAALCVTCDSDIHSANPLAQRHERVPVEPFFDSPVNFPVAGGNGNGQNDVEEGVSWLLPIHSELNPKVELGNYADGKAACDHIFFSEMDQFLDFEYGQNSIDGRFQQKNQGTDSVVPVQSKAAPPVPVVNGHESCFDIDFCRSKLSTFNYPSQSLSQSVSSSSLDVGVVPDGSSMSEITHPFIHNINGGTDPGAPISGSTSNQPTQLCGIDREARVLRYREKRKNRKFEKTIRYASRKAYAETRPRIKGRFAKRTEIESHMDRLYNPVSVPFMAADTQYGVVPSF